MTKTIVLGLVVAALGTGCTVVAPGNPDGGKNIITPFPVFADALPPPRSVEASLLIVANLERSAVNMSDRYAEVITRLGGFLDGVGLKLVSMGLIATYGDHYGPRLLLGRREGAPPSPTLAGVDPQRTDRQHPRLRRPAAADRHRARQHQRGRSADCAQAARSVGQLRRRRRDVRGEEPDRVRTWVGRRGAVARAGRRRTQRAVRQAAHSVHHRLPAIAAAALRARQRGLPGRRSQANRHLPGDGRIGRGGVAELRRTRHQAGGRSFTSPSRRPKRRASTRSGPAAGRSPAFPAPCST